MPILCRRILLLTGLLICTQQAAGASTASIVPLQFKNSRSAAEAWISRDQSPKPGAVSEGTRFTIPFSDGRDRVHWDHDAQLDLEHVTSFILDLTCDQPDAMRSLAIYLRSGSGWYVWNQPLANAGRQRLVLRKNEFTTEGDPDGWDRINRIRISPWKGRGVTTDLTLHALTARADSIFILKATRSIAAGGERAAADLACRRVANWLEQGGIPYALVEETGAQQAFQDGSTLILPYNPSISGSMIKQLQTFTARGGSLIVLYSSSKELAAMMGLRLGSYMETRDIARWRSLAVVAPDHLNIPSTVHQQAWSLIPVHPKDKGTGVIAVWADASGTRSTIPALVRGRHGFWLTTVLRDDDLRGKKELFTGLLASLHPDMWRSTARHELERAGKVDGYASFPETLAALRGMASGHPDRETLLAFAEKSRRDYDNAMTLYRKGSFREATLEARKLHAQLVLAYSLAMKPRPGEFRGIWDHDGTGWYPGDWDRTCREIKDAGFNAIFINALWAGLAHYPSRHVPGSFTLKIHGDQLDQCIRAAKRHGLAVHLWKVCWMVENAPEDFRKKLESEGRLQVNRSGKTIRWMDPAHPVNIRQELAAIEEAARAYPLDGVHLDYIRYPDASASYSQQARKAFEADTGRRVANWPEDVLDGGLLDNRFRSWRAGTITRFVRDVRKQLRSINPDIQLSAAVWGAYPRVADSIGQDWVTWLQEDLIDFACPMNYAEDLYRFTGLLDQQLSFKGVQGKLVSGIGVTAAESLLEPDKVIEQILALRKRNVRGFILFDLSKTLELETLPALRRGLTRE